MPNGSRHVPCARPMASRKSAAVSSSQCTDSLFCVDGCDGAGAAAGACAHTMEAQSALMESSSVLCTGSSSMRGPRALTLLARGDSRQVRAAARRLYGWRRSMGAPMLGLDQLMQAEQPSIVATPVGWRL